MGGLLSKMPPRRSSDIDRHHQKSPLKCFAKWTKNSKQWKLFTNTQKPMKQKEEEKRSNNNIINNLWKLESSSPLLSCCIIWGSWTRKVQRVSSDLRTWSPFWNKLVMLVLYSNIYMDYICHYHSIYVYQLLLFSFADASVFRYLFSQILWASAVPKPATRCLSFLCTSRRYLAKMVADIAWIANGMILIICC